VTAFPEPENEWSSNPADSEKLSSLGTAILVIAVVLAWWGSPLTDPLQLFAGLAIMVLGSLPCLLWARHRRPWFPCFEISTLTCVVFYGIPLLTQHDELIKYPDGVTLTAGFLVVGYLATAIVVFNSVTAPRNAPSWAATKLLPDNIHRYLPIGLLVNTSYLFIDRFTTIIPHQFAGTVRAICFGLGIITAFILSCEWGRSQLSREAKIMFVTCVAVQVLLLFSNLYLIGGMSLLILSAIGYTTTRRRLPWVAMLLCLPIVAVLHNGKSEMREIYWRDRTPLPSLGGLPEFFVTWAELGMQKKGADDSSTLAGRLAERASLFQMLCMSVDQVPERRPHLNGESYIDIPAQVIPRFLWPDKPSSLMSNVRLAIYFDLIDPDNAFATSIAFGVIAEAYVNFGFLGVLVLGALTGFGFKHVVLRSIGTPLFSAVGIFMILLTAWSFQAEQVMATWLSSLFQACAICILLPLLSKRFSNAE
jgi:hypothetical protein